MATCSRCLAFTDDATAYCSGCGKPRIAESLRAPVIPASWHIPSVPLQQTLVVVTAVWLLITCGVAFLREWKAVRDGEALIGESKFAPAWNQLGPFVAEHPEHAKGAFLCGQAALRLGFDAPAKECLDHLSSSSPELAAKLLDDFRGVLATKARTIDCSAATFTGLLDEASRLSAPLVDSVVGALDGTLDRCRAGSSDHEAWEIGAVLTKRGLAGDPVAKAYVAATNRALVQARYADARMLAQQGERVVPKHAADLEALLDGERRKVVATMTTLRGLCESIKVDPRYRSGFSWCFPAAAPPEVQAAKDGWGNPVHYLPQNAMGSDACRQGFVLAAYGVADRQEQGWPLTPASGIECRVSWGSEGWQLPARVWLAKESR
jgi:hypothetical protein